MGIPDRPLTCPVLIGRAPALQTIEAAISAAQEGREQVLLLAGEAGIGKSRLAREARAGALAAGMTVLQGNCFESDRPLPFAPLLDLLHDFCRDRPPAEIREALGPWAAQVTRLLPELAAFLPTPDLPPGWDAGQEKRDLFYALAQFAGRLAATRPLLLIVEDLHFADDSSLDAILYIARRAAAQPLLWLMTYRADEVGPGLGHFLAQLERERLAQRLGLGPLNLDEVAAMLEATLQLPRPAPPVFLDALYRLTEGNPFFVEEVLRSTTLPGAGEAWNGLSLDVLHALRAPTVQDVVQRRTERLGDAARRLLSVAAVAGRRFDFDLLQRVTRMDEAELLAQMRAAVAAQLVVEEQPEVFAFRHELTRQAILADLLSRERKALHLRIADALEGAAAPPFGDLAHHCYAAGDWPRTLDYARRAGDEAMALHAPGAAAEQYSHVLEAARHLGLTASSDLYAARGRAYEALDDFNRARGDFEVAWQIAAATGDRQAEWRALSALGFLWTGRDYATAGDYLRRALALARQIGDPALTARSLNRAGNWHLNQEQPAEAARYHEEAQAIFGAIGDTVGLAETLELLGGALHFSADQLRAERYFGEAAELWRQTGQRAGMVALLAELAVTGPSYASDTTVTGGRSLAQALQDVEEALAIARGIGWQSGEANVLFLLAERVGWHGRYGQALACAGRALAIAEQIEHRQWIAAGHSIMGRLYVDMLVLGQARAYLARALELAHEVHSQVFVRETAASLALACAWAHDFGGAEAALNGALGSLAAPPTQAQRHLLAAQVELALARRDPGTALELTDRLIATAAPGGGPATVVPRLALLRGRALAALGGRLDEAAGCLEAAAEAARDQEGLPLVWRSELALARLWRKAGRSQLAARHQRAAWATAEALAAEIPEPELRGAFLAAAAAQAPHAPSPSPREGARQAAAGLTPREWEVALLVAQGKTNREIAAALVLSERTVEGHVAGVLARLGFDSRSQIAVWVAEKNLRA